MEKNCSKIHSYEKQISKKDMFFFSNIHVGSLYPVCTCPTNMIKEIAKKEQKKEICHSAIVLEVLFQKWFPLEGTKS